MTRFFDLPPKWDGLPVEWEDGWSVLSTTFNICRSRLNGSRILEEDPEVCSGCGMVRQTSTRSGTITYRMGKQTRYRRLTAFRCVRCGHDQIVELTPTGVMCWDLDAEDYTEAGSYERQP